jgi:SAM-dependent methyltransferase
MQNILESHVVRLLRPLSIIDPVYDRAASLKVLSVGPRNENEVFHLIAHGFRPQNIEAIDVVSNSPLVRVADMHDIPFPDSSFDVVVSGWTLPYSRNAKLAIREKVRVLRTGGLLCLGLTRVGPDHLEYPNLVRQGSSIYLSSDQILADIGSAVEAVPFRHDPLDPLKKGAILVIARIRK